MRDKIRLKRHVSRNKLRNEVHSTPAQFHWMLHYSVGAILDFHIFDEEAWLHELTGYSQHQKHSFLAFIQISSEATH